MVNIKLSNISKNYPNGFKAIENLNFTIEKNKFVVLLGPSGCGKSTILRMIAGLEDISSGDLIFNDNKINDLPPKDRNIGMVFQNYALYPHLSVFDNIAFPLKVLKYKKDEIKTEVNKVAEMVNLGNLLDRLPKQLSGGQRQRVALARALIRKPAIFLFDEPLSNLDAQLRAQMRNEIVQLHRLQNATTIYVTHDQTEALTMADEIILLKDGKIQQQSSPQNIYEKPANLFVAEFIGSPNINLFSRSEFEKVFNFVLTSKNDNQINFQNPNVETIAIRPENIDISYQSNKDGNLLITNIENMGYEYIVYFIIAEKQTKSTLIQKNYTIRLSKETFEKLKNESNENLKINSLININFKPNSLLIYDKEGNLIN